MDRKKNYVITCRCPIDQIVNGALPMSRTFTDGSTYIETSAYYHLSSSSSSSLFHSDRKHEIVRRIPMENKREREKARAMDDLFLL